jgi:hypothetical protein
MREDPGATTLLRAPRWIVATVQPIVAAEEVAGGVGQLGH